MFYKHGLKRRLMSTQVQTPPRAVLDATPEDVRSFPTVSFIHTARKHADIIFGKMMRQLGSASQSSEATSCTHCHESAANASQGRQEVALL